MKELDMIKVYFDGICGYCSKEINYYRKISNEGIFEWVDVAKFPNAMAEYGITQADALLFLHAVDGNNDIYVGAEAFALIWKNLRKWRLLGIIISLPVIRTLAKHIYVWFARRRFRGYRHCQLASRKLS